MHGELSKIELLSSVGSDIGSDVEPSHFLGSFRTSYGGAYSYKEYIINILEGGFSDIVKSPLKKI